MRLYWNWVDWRLYAMSQATHMIDMHVMIGYVPTTLHLLYINAIRFELDQLQKHELFANLQRCLFH